MIPKIAITCWKRGLPTFLGDQTVLYTLADEYVQSVSEPGALPLLLPHLSRSQVDELLDVVDGLVIAGGGDLDPSSYQRDDAGSYDTDLQADGSEIALARRAHERGIPTLAICRGMQVVNVAHGGSLLQDMVAPDTPHPPMVGGPDAVLALRHRVHIDDGSRLGAVLGVGDRDVNTIHHQAVDVIAPGFHVTARADDGIIEAIEADDGWDFLGVQWHPEKLAGQDAALFTWLADAAGAQTRRR